VRLHQPSQIASPPSAKSLGFVLQLLFASRPHRRAIRSDGWKRAADRGELESDEVGVDVVTGIWRGGRLGTVRGLRSGHRAFGFVAFCEKTICHVTIDMRFAYRELLKRVMIFFESRIPPVAMNETLRIMEFIEAARTSANSSNQTIGFG